MDQRAVLLPCVEIAETQEQIRPKRAGQRQADNQQRHPRRLFRRRSWARTDCGPVANWRPAVSPPAHRWRCLRNSATAHNWRVAGVIRRRCRYGLISGLVRCVWPAGVCVDSGNGSFSAQRSTQLFVDGCGFACRVSASASCCRASCKRGFACSSGGKPSVAIWLASRSLEARPGRSSPVVRPVPQPVDQSLAGAADSAGRDGSRDEKFVGNVGRPSLDALRIVASLAACRHELRNKQRRGGDIRADACPASFAADRANPADAAAISRRAPDQTTRWTNRALQSPTAQTTAAAPRRREPWGVAGGCTRRPEWIRRGAVARHAQCLPCARRGKLSPAD